MIARVRSESHQNDGITVRGRHQRLLQQNLPKPDSCSAAKSTLYSITASARASSVVGGSLRAMIRGAELVHNCQFLPATCCHSAGNPRLEFLHFINCHRNWEPAAKKRFPDDPFKDNRPIDAQFGSAKDLFLGFQFREWPLVLQSDGDNRLSGSLIKIWLR